MFLGMTEQELVDILSINNTAFYILSKLTKATRYTMTHFGLRSVSIRSLPINPKQEVRGKWRIFSQNLLHKSKSSTIKCT